jgi:hypothetical protein
MQPSDSDIMQYMFFVAFLSLRLILVNVVQCCIGVLESDSVSTRPLDLFVYRQTYKQRSWKGETKYGLKDKWFLFRGYAVLFKSMAGF